MIHDLKIDPIWYGLIQCGFKTWEIRSEEDRRFDVGDHLLLRSWTQDRGYLAKPPIEVNVRAVARNDVPGLKKGYCVMSIEVV